ncbi:hypothetical protein PGT21_005541 [Puccinia graminis f. sp. tritici]|uniref:Uncharacterized protein n=1 Tax=Puccinia graminis f. sp. tritici TaxID=56615 RepID=A0A5B0QSJ9_PUCGR|nr:hypothetical protein PGT21_005541 [Puccinia graminis f. sp. tritici]
MFGHVGLKQWHMARGFLALKGPTPVRTRLQLAVTVSTTALRRSLLAARYIARTGATRWPRGSTEGGLCRCCTGCCPPLRALNTSDYSKTPYLRQTEFNKINVSNYIIPIGWFEEAKICRKS